MYIIIAPPYKPETFDRILLDGPCSGFGQRPLIRYKLKLSELLSYHKYQQKLIKQVTIIIYRYHSYHSNNNIGHNIIKERWYSSLFNMQYVTTRK